MIFIPAIKWVWALALPWVGPVLPPLLRNIPALATIRRWGRRAFIAALILAALVSLYVVMRTLRNPVEERVSAAEVNASLYAERNRQLTQSVASLQRTLQVREREKADAEKEIAELRATMEVSRAQSPNPDAVVFPADDPWLRAKQRR